MNEGLSSSEKVSALDEVWFPKIKAIIFEDYEEIAGDGRLRTLEKEAFLRGDTTNPLLDYSRLNETSLNQREVLLHTLKEEVLDEEKNTTVREIYRTKINELLAANRMLLAAYSGNDRRFQRYSDFIYGKPDAEHVAYIQEAVRQKMLTKLKSPDSRKVEAASKLLAVLGESSAINVLDKPVCEGIEPGEVLESAEQAMFAIQQKLQAIGASGWDVLVDSKTGVSNFSVSQSAKSVIVPSTEQIVRRGITARKLTALLEHEVGVHVARRENGERSVLKLLGLGLDRYVRGEEGVATYAEQQITGAKEYAGIPKFFAIALAKGMIDDSKRDFRGVYEVLRDYYIAMSPDKGDLEGRAAEVAWNDCVRIFRGTSCATPGAVFSKDLVYFAGNREVWQLVNADAGIVQTFQIGKYDPANERHVALLVQLGILDADLVLLSKSDAQESDQ